MTVQNIIDAIEHLAPRQLQEEYDNAGLQCGDPRQEVTHVLCCIDVTEQVLDEARREGCQLILSHHPLLFRGTRCVSPVADDYVSRCLYHAIRLGIAIYSAHTNLDNAPKGVNYHLANLLALNDLKPLSPIPASRLDGLDDCYEEQSGSGLIGTLSEPMSGDAFLHHVATCLGIQSLRINDDCSPSPAERLITRVALCGGSGGEFISAAERQHADAYLTGEIGYHRLFGHPEILLIEAGHYETEKHTAALLAEIVRKNDPEVKVSVTATGNQTPVFLNDRE